MRLSVQREVLLKPLQQAVNVVERRQTLPVLANLLLQVEGGALSVTGTDTEVEMISHCAVEDSEDGQITVPARKLFDIVRALPDGVRITFSVSVDKATLQAGRSRFVLATLPADEFPLVESIDLVDRVRLPETRLQELIERTAFAMAIQDVRYYLNGLLLDLKGAILRSVSTDGHRMAVCETEISEGSSASRQLIVPRKGVAELQRMLEGADREVELEIGRNHVRLHRDDATFTSKLIEGRFPDYESVIPIGANKTIQIDREALRASLQRVAILSNEKYRGVRLDVSPGQLRVAAHNPLHEEAVEELEADTGIDNLSIGFNVTYLLDALGALREEKMIIQLRDGNSSALLREVSHERARFVIMPMRL